MSDTSGVRWYRHGGNRLGAPIMIFSLMGLFPAALVVYGIGHPLRWQFLIPGAVLVAAIAALAWLPVRAGIGVTSEHILIRSSFGDTRAIPWAQVTGFEYGVEDPNDKSKNENKSQKAVLVLTSGGERLQTGGYAPDNPSLTEAWPLLRTLEAERLARTPGAESTLPPAPPPGREKAGETTLYACLSLVVLLGFGVGCLYAGVTGIGPGLRATHGEGTVGYFVPTDVPGGKGAVSGNFRLPDGTVSRRDTGIEDLGKDKLHVGIPVASLDTGDPDGVFPRDDPGAWHSSAIMLVWAAWCLWSAIMVITREGIRLFRRVRHRAGAAEP